jgi:hypothetical protein
MATIVMSPSEFVQQAQLPVEVMRGVRRDGIDPVQAALATAQQQAAVVGSGILGFVEGVTPERRQAIVNSALLAQLVARRQVPDTTQIDAWYDVYFDVLAHLGWVIQDQGFAEYREATDDFTAHKAILEVATALLGPSPTALALVTTTLNALLSMGQDDPWIRIFSRESQTASLARFQIGLVEKGPDDAFRVALMAFALEASSEITQVLFFKARSASVAFRHRSGEVTIDADALDSARDAMRLKLAGITGSYVAALEI